MQSRLLPSKTSPLGVCIVRCLREVAQAVLYRLYYALLRITVTDVIMQTQARETTDFVNMPPLRYARAFLI
jgi:hypothetical protein